MDYTQRVAELEGTLGEPPVSLMRKGSSARSQERCRHQLMGLQGSPTLLMALNSMPRSRPCLMQLLG
jgi:hypothetical protein